MRIFNFIFLVILMTSIMLLYTYQRVEAIKLSYKINECKLQLHKLLDHRRGLEYNVAKLKTPNYLKLQLAKKEVNLVLPERWEVFEETGLNEERSRVTSPSLVRRIAGRFFLGSEAQATPPAK